MGLPNYFYKPNKHPFLYASLLHHTLLVEVIYTLVIEKNLIKFWGDISMLYQPTTYRTNKPKIQIKSYNTDDDIHILVVHRHI